MFHFPTFPPHTLYIQARVTGHDSSWVSPFGHPRINARLPTPQGLSQAPTSFIGSRCQGIHHVPLVACQTKTATKMLASTVQFSKYGRHPHRSPPGCAGSWFEGARVLPETDVSGPNSVSKSDPPDLHPRFHAASGSTEGCRVMRGRTTISRRSTSEHPLPQDVCLRNRWIGQHPRGVCRMLLRKEVIQPHLPVRLPCYDFVPIASPTFDGSLHKGWATGFGCCRLS